MRARNSMRHPANQQLLSIFGGKITTCSGGLAEAALALLQPHLPPVSGQMAGWTGQAKIAGRRFSGGRFLSSR